MAEPPDETTRRLEEEVEDRQAGQRAAHHSHEPSPSEFRGNFAGFIDAVRRHLEAQYGDEMGGFESVADRAATEAQFIAAQAWLVERWGTHFACPVCANVEWYVSEVGPAIRPPGFLAFAVTCGYCGYSMDVVPGRADQDAPIRATQQIEFPAGE